MMKKKYLKVFIFILLGFVLLFPTVSYASTTANTLAELRKELASYKATKSSTEKKQKATESEIASAKSSVSSKQAEIEANQTKIQEAQAESVELEKEIAEGKEELEKLIQNYQIASGDNLYLEYIFEATSYEDLIYRYAVIEQIMNYQNEQIAEWNDKIAYNEQLKIDLEEREVTLNNQISDLADEIEDLNEDLEDYFDITMDVQDEIDSTQELIEYYEDMGCEENQNLTECINMLGDTGFVRPLSYGVITSVWGYRTHPVTGRKNTFHNGIDIGGNKVGTSIYAAANGKVGKIIYKASCGGNQVYIYHTINGKKYTTSYLHLNSINVKLGQTVTSQTVIGTVGGQKGTGDSCTTGTHLHFGMGSGWYGSDYVSSSKWKANSINPTTMISFPSKGTYFKSRY